MTEPAQPAAGRGVLVLAATPIGTMGDATPRLTEELRGADVVAAEDTRRLGRLLAGLGLGQRGRLVSYFEGNETRRTRELIAALERGERVVLVTDAGTPSVSDPGYRLVVAAVEAGATVTAVPGPSAVVTALAVSGLEVDRFCFEGFVPRKATERANRLRALADELRTMVFFESPRRLGPSLEAMASAFGAQRRGVVCRELTKLHEEIRRGPLAELATWASAGVRGEITVVVAGASRDWPAFVAPAELARRVAELLAVGQSRKQAMTQVAAATGVSRRVVYDAVVAAKPRSDP